jgi:hypothetical protein
VSTEVALNRDVELPLSGRRVEDLGEVQADAVRPARRETGRYVVEVARYAEAARAQGRLAGQRRVEILRGAELHEVHAVGRDQRSQVVAVDVEP